MSDKMYVKDFVEALDEAGFDFSVYGFDGILNIIGLYCRCQADKYKEQAVENHDIDYMSLAEWETARAEKIHALLEERGFFE